MVPDAAGQQPRPSPPPSPPPLPADCFIDPTVCGVKPFQICQECSGNYGVGCCVTPPAEVNCYAQPGICGKSKWCQLNDRQSWNDTDTTTRGRCVPFQAECESCTATFNEDNPPVIPGLNAYAFYSTQAALDDRTKPLGTYLTRETRCNPNAGLVCTGKVVPSLPPTCVPKRKLPAGFDRATRANLLEWGKRMLRMGARNAEGASGRGPADQDPQGSSREEIHAGANMILKTLWNTQLWGEFQPLDVASTYSERCCRWANYTAQLSDFQRNRTGPSFRNPLAPRVQERGNSPPCVWCAFDGAYNDENPSIWSLIHALTFNLPTVVNEAQFQVLQSLPLWLRQHLSCPLCRSHIEDHLIKLGIPESHDGRDWAHFYWRAHNYVNEQSEVTRCGSQSCGWGVWQTPPAYKCAGSYRYPWFLPFGDATSQWRNATQSHASW